MTARFHIADDIYDLALAQVLKWEGGYVNDPADPGGATNFGVTHKVYDAYRRRNGLTTRHVSRITMAEVEEIYRKRYWELAHCQELPAFLAMAHFDWAVNTGKHRALRHLQEVVGTKADGIWGPKTRAAIKKAVCERGEFMVVAQYLDRRERYYSWLGSKGKFRRFRRGWMNRLNDLRRELRRLGWEG